MKDNIAKLRKELLNNCDEAQNLLRAAQRIIPAGSEYLETQSVGTETEKDEATFTGTLSPSRYSHKLMHNILVLVHAIVIQEWHIFLNEVFAQAVLHYMKGGKLKKPPSGQLELRRLGATRKITEMRESIHDSAKERFGGLGYKDRIDRLRGIFGISFCGLDEMLKKHVVIRNIFQHHRGKVRESDIKEIDEQYQDIDVIDDDGDVRSFSAGRKIVLSNAEIKKLQETIEKYSEKFEKKAETF
ncbi:MAG: hypothetical protein PVG93_03690 [Phycisphaerales bacterium]|jgi:hypothetical protein